MGIFKYISDTVIIIISVHEVIDTVTIPVRICYFGHVITVNQLEVIKLNFCRSRVLAIQQQSRGDGNRD